MSSWSTIIEDRWMSIARDDLDAGRIEHRELPLRGPHQRRRHAFGHEPGKDRRGPAIPEGLDHRPRSGRGQALRQA
jgi:hypothetical protein